MIDEVFGGYARRDSKSVAELPPGGYCCCNTDMMTQTVLFDTHDDSHLARVITT